MLIPETQNCKGLWIPQEFSSNSTDPHSTFHTPVISNKKSHTTSAQNYLSMQQNHTSHSRQEMTTDIHRHHTVQSVPCIHWHQYVQQSGSGKICALQTFYCHAMLRCMQRNIVGCKERSSTDHKTRLAHVTVEYLSYRPSPRWTHRAVRTTTNLFNDR